MSGGGRVPLESGTMIQGYRIVRKIGQGGFGIVYEAYHDVMEKRVAIKEYFPQHMDVSREGTRAIAVGEDSRELYDKFLDKFRETTKHLSKLDHPNIVKVIGYEEGHGTGYMVMEYVEGVSLKAWRDDKENRVFRKKLVDIMKPVFEALVYLHSEKMYHRDISPINIMVAAGNKPVIIDFGALKHDMVQEGRDGTASTVVQANPDFAPMEQLENDDNYPIGPWTDVYALGATLFALTRRENPMRVTKRLQGKAARNGIDPFDSANYDARIKLKPEEFAAIDKALELLPGDRFQSIAEFGEALGWYGTAVTPKPEPVQVGRTEPGSEPDTETKSVQTPGDGPADGTTVPVRKVANPIEEEGEGVDKGNEEGGGPISDPPIVPEDRGWLKRNSRLVGGVAAILVAGLVYLIAQGTDIGASECLDVGRFDHIKSERNLAGLRELVRECGQETAPHISDARDLEENWSRQDALFSEIRSSGSLPQMKDFQETYPDGLHSETAGELVRQWGADDAFWTEASRSGAKADYEAYLERYPGGRHAEEAGLELRKLDSDERRDWQQISDSRRKADFRNHLRRYPGGRYAEEAGMRIRQLEEEDETEWRRIRNSESIAEFRSYVRRFPDGNHIGDARDRIEELDVAAADDRAFEQARRLDSIEAYFDYLRRFPRGRHVEEAEQRIEALRDEQRKQREEAAWLQARETDTIGGYENFLAEYPNSRYSKVARERIERKREDELALNALRQQSPILARDYLDRYPQGRYRRQILTLINKLEEQARPADSCDDRNATQSQQRAWAFEVIDGYYSALTARNVSGALYHFPSMGEATQRSVRNFEFAYLDSNVTFSSLGNGTANARFRVVVKAFGGRAERWNINMLLFCKGQRWQIENTDGSSKAR